MQTILILRHTKLECWQHKFNGILSFARPHNWQLQTVDCSSGRITLPDLLDFWKPAGCILEADGERSPFNLKSFGNLPLVCIDHSPKMIEYGASVVRHDSAAIARLAAHELLSLDFPHAAIAGFRQTTYWQTDKINAFRKIVSLHGLSVSECLIERSDPCSETAVHSHLKKWLVTLPKPCCIFGVNDLIAGHVIAAAAELKLEIPEQIAVIGADDDPLICEAARPSMSSIRPDFRNSGNKAAELLLRRLESPRMPPEVCVVPPLGIIRRQSTRLLSTPDHSVSSALERIRLEAKHGLRAIDVLSEFSCSRRRAEARFRAAVGRSILEEIQRARFEESLRCLKDSTLPISVVSDLSGWPSSLVLSRYAKTTTGKTLSQLRHTLDGN